ncbi:hypothetical protein [Persephonella sp.]
MVFFLVAYNYFSEFRSINRSVAKREFSFSIPEVPVIKVDLKAQKKSSISDFGLWNINQKGIVLSQKTSKEMEKILSKKGFVVKNIGGVLSICSVVDDKYRWEFYGIVYKNGRLLAVFYNPSLKKKRQRVVGKSERLDNGLFVKDIGADNVTVVCCGGKKVFKLSMFSVEKKLSGRKKK